MIPSYLDPTIRADWEIAQAAEASMKSIDVLAGELGLESEEVIPMGRRLCKVDYRRVCERTSRRAAGRYVDVTAITPTPLGEGKTTTTMGLVQGFGKLNRRVTGAIRQPSGGPTFNIKGSAAGGGRSQCIPLTELSMGLTGDIDAITNAHNLCLVALTARMQHERNYDDARLARSKLRRLDIDPDQVQIKWALDFCAQSLRRITIGQGGKMDGFEMQSGFQISVSSELMAILAIARDLRDLRERIAKVIVAYDRNGAPVTTVDLEVDGAMAAWLVKAINPNLLQTIEGQPVFVHAGPFANIAIGQSSIIADILGTRLSEYHITESGFGADVGYEKFWNLKCRASGLTPDAVVIVATVRALKMHGGGPKVTPGVALDAVYREEDCGLVEQGCENLQAHMDIVRKSGIRPIVCINRFYTDTDAETDIVRRAAEANGGVVATANHWRQGGEGAIELAEAVISVCDEEKDFNYLYDLDSRLDERIETIAREIYGADGVHYSQRAWEKVRSLNEDPDSRNFGTCMVKTQLSLSHDPELKNRPVGWQLPIEDVLIFNGAGLIVPVAGNVSLMPGTASNPSFRKIDIDVETGNVTGLF